MKQDHLHPPSVSTTPLRICSTPIRLHRHRRALAAHLFRLHDITAPLRTFAVLYFVSTTNTHFVSPTSLHICGSPTISSLRRPSVCLTDIAAHLQLTHFVSTILPHPCGTPLVSTTTHFVSPTSPRTCSSPTSSHRHHRTFAVHPFVSSTSLRICSSPIPSPRHHRILAVLYFVSTTTHFVPPTSLRICGTPTLSHRHRRAFAVHPLSLRHHRALAVHPFVSPTSLRICGSSTSSPRHRRAFMAHPLCLYDIATSLRYSISSLRPPPPTLSHQHCRALAVHPLSHRHRAFAVHSIWSLRLHPPSQYFYFLPFGHLSHERECQIICDRAHLP
jgi:hypothetical protein